MRRREDRALLMGAGRYTDDLVLPGLLHVALLRSPHAHARLVRLDPRRAAAAPGVAAVVTGADVRELGHMPSNRIVPSMKVPPHPLLAEGIVVAVGDAVAAVVADTSYRARDAAELIEAEYEPLPPLPDPEAALAAGAPAVHAALPGNLAFTHRWRSGDVDAAFAGTPRAGRVRVRQPRVAALCMEPRVILAWLDPSSAELRIWSSTQTPFRMRAEIAAVIGYPESRIRVTAPEVGGGFGVKGSPYREDALVAWLALRLERPVKWIATRSEDILTTNHGRGAEAEGEMAVDADGRIRGLRARVVFPLGGRFAVSGAGPAWNSGRTMPGPYAIPSVDIEIAGAVTTTSPTGAYRGAGRPEGTFMIERLMDEAAHAAGLDPVAIRRQNLVPPDAFPYTTATAVTYDSGRYAEALDRCLELSGYAQARERQRAAQASGSIIGVGVVVYVEPAAVGWESGSVRVERTGAVTVVTGSSAHGQGHETTWAQIVADALGVRPEDVVVRHGDTGGTPQGFGTFGSRSTALGGSAAFRAAEEVREKGRRVAAHLLEAAPADVTPAPGGFHVVGAPARRATWAQVAAFAHGPTRVGPGDTPGLEATCFFQAAAETWSFGAAVAVVEIDRDTGQVTLARCTWVDDAGVIVNPLLAEGQLHGAYAQGAGQALLEGLVYDEAGQLATGTLMDYAVPRVGDFPEPVIGKMVTPSPHNPLGAKGLGEAGCIVMPPVIVNAVVDALRPFGVTNVDMPLT
ncbi:MAG TPA: xanthine dehydrogenase family protein molybdopterin-binding subunit, partial [Methylomirabilota bacterium]|nr:xanthine dehydrogenase family protein molybdopterin-binding subunit [Methylomirabilota bacterium]